MILEITSRQDSCMCSPCNYQISWHNGNQHEDSSVLRKSTLGEGHSKNHYPTYPRPPRKVQGQQIYISYPSAIMRAKRLIKLSHEDYHLSSTISKLLTSLYEDNQQEVLFYSLEEAS